MKNIIIVISLFFLSSCKEEIIKVVNESPNINTYKPNAIFAATDDTNVSIGTVRMGSVGQNTISVVARLDHDSGDQDEFFFNFPGLSYAELPQNISTAQGRSGEGIVLLTLDNDEFGEITCAYTGAGSQASTAPTCGSNGYHYTFKYCIQSKHFISKKCINDLDKKACTDKVISEYQPWVKVPTTSVGAIVESGDNCAMTEIQFPMAYYDYNEYNGIKCGDLIEGDFTFQADLDCSDYPGYALAFSGDGASIDGNGYKVIAPNGAMAITMLGDDQRIENLSIVGNPDGVGILAYDTDKIRIKGNTISNVNIGIHIMSYHVEIDDIRVEDNVASGLGEFGLYVNAYHYQDTYAKKARVRGNDFSNSGDNAIHLSIQEFTIDGDFDNDISGSRDGLYLAEGKFQIKNEFFDDLVSDTTIFVYRADEVIVEDVEISGHNGNEDESETGLHFYMCDKVIVDNVEIYNKDIGIKVATKYGKETDVNIENSIIVDNVETGIMLQSYDGTTLNDVVIKNNDLRRNKSVERALWEVQDVPMASTDFSNNQF